MVRKEVIFLLGPASKAGGVDLENHSFLVNHEFIQHLQDHQLLGISVPVTVIGPTSIILLDIATCVESSWVINELHMELDNGDGKGD